MFVSEFPLENLSVGIFIMGYPPILNPKPEFEVFETAFFYSICCCSNYSSAVNCQLIGDVRTQYIPVLYNIVD